MTWTAPAGDIASYEIHRRPTTPDGRYQRIGRTNHNESSFSHPVSDLVPDTEYDYRVKPVTGTGEVGGWGSGSNYARATAPPLSDLKAELVPKGVSLTWTAPAGDAASYKIYRMAERKSYWFIATSHTPAFLDPMADLVPGVDYYYRIKPSALMVWLGLGPGSNDAQATAPAVKGLKAIVYSNGVTVSWEKPVGDAASYQVYRRVAKPGEVYVEIAERKVPYYWDPVSGLTPGTEYYRVKPVSSAGVVGGWGPGNNYALVRIPTA